MDILRKKELTARYFASQLDFKVEFIPGEIEEFDSYKATHDFLPVTCYGPSEEEARSSAINESTGIFLNEMNKISEELKVRQKKGPESLAPSN